MEDTGPFERQLVVLGELAAAGLVAAQQRIDARTDDELIGGIVAAAGKDRALHGGQDQRLVAALLDQRQCRVQRVVGEIGGLLGLGDLGRALEQSQPADNAGCVGDLAEGLQLLVQPAAIVGGQAMGIVFDPNAGAKQVEVVEQVAQVDRRVGAVAVGPQHDVVDDRGVARLAQVGRAGQEHHRAVGLHHQALEEAEAERVVAGQPVHAFLREQQDGVELLLGHLDHQPVAPRVKFRSFKMQRHYSLSKTMAETCRP